MAMRPYDERPVLPPGILLEVVLEARYIPGGATVRKVHGVAEHTLVRKVRIYPKKDVEGVEKQILEGNGCVFLESEGQEGTFNVYSPDTRFVWLVELESLVDQVQWQQESHRSK